MKKIVVKNGLLRFILSSIIAFIILTLFCVFYYNVPQNKPLDGTTDYKWKSNTFYSRATEGFALGKTNNDGYVNDYDFNDKTDIDVLIVGSSQMEALEVNMNETTSSLLNKKLKNQNVYNIGISGHYFLNCVSNLESAIKKYNPKKYLIIETSSLTFDDESLIKTINNELEEIPFKANGILGILQQNQFIRLAYKQLRSFIDKKSINDEEDILNINNSSNYNAELLNKLFIKIRNISSKTNIIILYHPSTTIADNGKLILSSESENVEEFKKLCNQNGIDFLDMSDRFKQEYENNYLLPYGFSNTTIGTGHLNKYGHQMIADELFKIIERGK